jgi:carbonic anhydrase
MKTQTCLFFALTLAATTAFAADTSAPWGYEGNTGPADWGKLSPAYAACTEGKTQTPINIQDPLAKNPVSAVIHYEPLPLAIINDGDTELKIGSQQVVTNTGHGIQINYHGDDARESLTYQGTVYHLVQFHFHAPAETKWNGFQYPLEIHFVNESDDGKVAVLAVFVAADNGNVTLQNIIDHLPKEAKKEMVLNDVQLNIKALLPMHATLGSFMGSLTTPPCTEGLQWLVYQHPITASTSQIQSLAKAMGHANARPLQALNGRVVEGVSADSN